MKTSALLRELHAGGAVVVRQRGSHRIFRLPNGARVVVPVSGAHTEATPGVVRKARAALAALPSPHPLPRILR